MLLPTAGERLCGGWFITGLATVKRQTNVSEIEFLNEKHPPESFHIDERLMKWLLLQWILQNMVRHFVTHKQM